MQAAHLLLVPLPLRLERVPVVLALQCLIERSIVIRHHFQRVSLRVRHGTQFSDPVDVEDLYIRFVDFLLQIGYLRLIRIHFGHCIRVLD